METQEVTGPTRGLDSCLGPGGFKCTWRQPLSSSSPGRGRALAEAHCRLAEPTHASNLRGWLDPEGSLH